MTQRCVRRRLGAAFLPIPMIFFAAAPAAAAPRGSEFDTTLTPAAGGMEGVAIARAPDPVAMLFANPATLGQLKGRTSFTLGASFVSPTLDASGPATGVFGGAPSDANPPLTGAFSGTSRLDLVGAPHAAAVQRFTDKFVMGFGVTAISGLGGDFRDVEGIPNLSSDLKVFGANLGAAYDVTDRLTLGATATLGIGALQIGLTDISSSVNDFGVGGTVGATYEAGPIILGAAWKAPLSITYRQVLEVAQDDFAGVELTQPWEAQFGLATSDAFLKNTYVAFDYRFKAYGRASTYQDIWRGLHTGSLGVQHTIETPLGAMFLRGGYTLTSRLRKPDEELGSTFAGNSFVANPNFDPATSPPEAALFPVTPTFLQLAQGTIANGYWRQSVSLGAGWRAMETMRLDINGDLAFDGTVEKGPFRSEGRVWSVGMGITWTFG